MCRLDRNALPGTSTARARLVLRGGWFRPITDSEWIKRHVFCLNAEEIKEKKELSVSRGD